MLVFILAASFASAATHGLQPDRAFDGTACRETPMSLARKRANSPPRAVPLGKLPAGHAFMAVDRRVNGCPAPLMMVRYRLFGVP